ncbi:MAG: photosystem II protein Y [Microcoleus sp. C1-bin4]|nr:photosystem II protein Y [Microcoleus sp. C1-bin4]
MDFDFRILIVLMPVLLAGGWAAYNIGSLALKPVQKMFNNQA